MHSESRRPAPFQRKKREGDPQSALPVSRDTVVHHQTPCKLAPRLTTRRSGSVVLSHPKSQRPTSVDSTVVVEGQLCTPTLSGGEVIQVDTSNTSATLNTTTQSSDVNTKRLRPHASLKVRSAQSHRCLRNRSTHNDDEKKNTSENRAGKDTMRKKHEAKSGSKQWQKNLLM